MGKPLLSPDVLAGNTWQLRCIECVVEEGEIQPCCMPAAVGGDISEINLAQCIFDSSTFFRAATDTYGKKGKSYEKSTEKSYA